MIRITNEQAIEILKDLWRYEHSEFSEKEIREALEKGIEALENQKTIIDELEKIKDKVIRDAYMMYDYSEEKSVITVDELCKIIHRRIFELK